MQLVSVSSDVDITQLVDGTVGVHVMIQKRISSSVRAFGRLRRRSANFARLEYT